MLCCSCSTFFFPMYPADGCKLLAIGLMYCCGVRPRRAALILVMASVVCAAIIIIYCLFQLRGAMGGEGGGGWMVGVMGMMAVMSLTESYRIWDLRKKKLLNTHPYFFAARSWNATRGGVTMVNSSDLDDEVEPTQQCALGDAVATCTAAACPCCWRGASRRTQDAESAVTEQAIELTLTPEEIELRRQHRAAFLSRAEAQLQYNRMSVRELEEERLVSRAGCE
mmetsp:Transcript_22674/g.51158  ORF Transcript_22674/g.51158 Transcript_22674/m.51158 type:complete len:224 (+) Transcript_22674:687-1358(+)